MTSFTKLRASVNSSSSKAFSDIFVVMMIIFVNRIAIKQLALKVESSHISSFMRPFICSVCGKNFGLVNSNWFFVNRVSI